MVDFSTGQRHSVAPPPAGSDVDPDIYRQRHSASTGAEASDVDRAIARRATRQDGVLTRAQLQAMGLSAGAVDHRVEVGRLIVIHRGVYAVGHAAVSQRGRLRAALLAAGPTAVLSHGTAAALWRILPSMPPSVHVTLTEGAQRRSRKGLIIHRTTNPPETRTHQSLPLTAPLRTLQDLKSQERERAAGEALVLELVTEQQLIRAGLMTDDVAPTRSTLERDLLSLVRRSALPQPLVNTRLGNHRPDFLWPDHKVILETDGHHVHGRRSSFESDRSRDAELAAQGYVVVRVTWRQLKREPLLVTARLAQVLAIRRSPPPRAPAAA